MFKKVITSLLIIFSLTSINANATTIIAVVGKRKIILAADTRLTMTKVDGGEKVFQDDWHKLYKLKNGVGVAFAGSTNSTKSLKSGKEVIVKSVTTIVNDLNNMDGIKDLSVSETAELIAEKYINILNNYTGEILVVGFEDDVPYIYGIRAANGKAMWKGVSGRGSFWAVGSGAEVFMNNLKDNLGCEENISNMDLGINYFQQLKDKEIKDVLEKSMMDCIDEYKENYRSEEQTTGGEVETLIISK